MVAKEMGNYCKAYLVSDLRRFPRWQERTLNDDDVVFVQETFVVTEGIFQNEKILFDAVDPEWIAFCQEALGFRIPDDVAVAVREQMDAGLA